MNNEEKKYRAKTCQAHIGNTDGYDKWIEFITPFVTFCCFDPSKKVEEFEELAEMLNNYSELEKQVKELSEWKESAMKILNEIDLQNIGKELNVPLGESVSKNLLERIKNHSEKSKIEGIILGLQICKEMWAQGTISHEEIYENELYYKEELDILNENFKK